MSSLPSTLTNLNELIMTPISLTVVIDNRQNVLSIIYAVVYLPFAVLFSEETDPVASMIHDPASFNARLEV